ncbi:MAG: hypothetical protein ACKESB_02780 [Candidatus Hodgkinia cicadicola]
MGVCVGEREEEVVVLSVSRKTDDVVWTRLTLRCQLLRFRGGESGVAAGFRLRQPVRLS